MMIGRHAYIHCARLQRGDVGGCEMQELNNPRNVILISQANLMG